MSCLARKKLPRHLIVKTSKAFFLTFPRAIWDHMTSETLARLIAENLHISLEAA
jgi:hypothetical protein